MTNAERRLLATAWIWQHEIEDRTVEGRQTLVDKLESACRSERIKALAGNWTYSFARHNALLRVLAREKAELQTMLTTTR